MGRSANAPWTIKLINRTRATTNKMIDSRCAAMTPDQRLRFVVGQVMLLANSPAPLQQLLRYFYVLTAFELHLVGGGLMPRHMNQLSEIGRSILEENGVLGESSRLGFLFGELLRLEGQIAALQGGVWLNAVRQDQSLRSARRADADECFPLVFSWGASLLRLGQASQALVALSRVDDARLPDAERLDLLTLRSRCLRLAGDYDAAREILSSHVELRDSWDFHKLEVAEAGRPDRLASLARRDTSHYQLANLLEATLLIRSSDHIMTHEHIPKVEALVRRKGMRDRSEPGLGQLIRFARVTESLDDVEKLVPTRIQILAEALNDAAKLRTLELEMIIWVVAARWLARMNAFDFAALTLRQYRSLCWNASDGRCSDTLRIAADLLAKPWFVTSFGVTKSTREAS